MTGKAVTTPQRNHAKSDARIYQGSTDFIYRTIPTCRDDMRVILMLGLLHDLFRVPGIFRETYIVLDVFVRRNMPYPVRNLPAQTESRYRIHDKQYSIMNHVLILDLMILDSGSLSCH